MVWRGERYQVEVGEGHARREGGGLLVAGVVKHADNVLKTYATAVAILATCAFTAVSTGVLPSVGFMQGLLLVIGSMFLYNSPLPSLPSLPRLRRD